MAKSTRTPADLRGVKLFVCSGGPRDGSWYTAEFWQQARACAVHGDETPHAGRTLGYLPTEALVDHPRWPQYAGYVLRWNPDRVAELDAREQQQEPS